jgi:6,7-dimethyl-8-ribityllumazine synthase
MSKKILIVEAPFYRDISDMLYAGATAVLDKAGAVYERVCVPGALEVPAAINFASQGGHYDGYIALGCVIRGETYHFEIVCNESARGLMDLSVHSGLALANGILTCENKDQAIRRADPSDMDKGGSFAQAVIDMMAHKDNFTKKV